MYTTKKPRTVAGPGQYKNAMGRIRQPMASVSAVLLNQGQPTVTGTGSLAAAAAALRENFLRFIAQLQIVLPMINSLSYIRHGVNP